jgi:hypothetical protein
MGIFGQLTRRNLAALAAERGDWYQVEHLWRDVLAECPGDRKALHKLNPLQTDGKLRRRIVKSLSSGR